MNSEIRNLEPKALWNYFADLNAVPRASKKEERVINFMVQFGKNLGLETITDKIGNVIIKKPATKGMENCKTIVLQSHLDMVHQKNADTVFDFDSEGIKMLVKNNWVTANGTTLGADNGLGVATIMAILASKTIVHPNIEALFTIDEETGMTGAMGLEKGYLNGEILLNLDTENDDEICIGCAGGIDVTAQKIYTQENTPENTVGFSISVTGLNGGHSGMDIDKGLGNANKIMNRLLYNISEKFDLRICEIDGGSLRNAIPRESFTTFVVSENKKESFIEQFNNVVTIIKDEFLTTDSSLSITLKEIESPKKVMSFLDQKQLIKCIYGILNGVYKMSPDIKGLVETSNNIARVIVKNGSMKIDCLTRSSCETNKLDLVNSLRCVFELANFKVVFSGSYPGWQPNINSDIVNLCVSLYEKLHDKRPNIEACHAGLECGILGQNYPDLDMVSFGPTILGAHSPDERVSIISTQKFWKFLLEILKHIPKKTGYEYKK